MPLFFLSWASRLIRVISGSIFLWAAAPKLLNPRNFALLIEAYGLVPESWLLYIAVGLAILEILAGLGLIFDLPGGLLLASLLLLLFIGVLGYGIWLGLDIDCGCFAPENPEPPGHQGLRPALNRDLFLAAGLVYLFWWRSQQRKNGSQTQPVQ